MIKVLQIMDGKSFGGITKMMLDIGNCISSDIIFEYLTAENIDERFYNLNINRNSLSGRVIFNYRLYKFLKINKYEIVHINSGAFFFTFFCVIVCKIVGVKRVIVHSHNTPKINFLKKILIKIFNPLYMKLTDAHLTCSNMAASSLFTKIDDVILLKNGIDVEKFKFNDSIRNQYRKKINICDKIVYGHVGRFHEQKNHKFLIDLFYEIQKEQDAVLLLIGIGELENCMKLKVKKLGIEDRVFFLGFRNDVDKILNAMDVFLFPSLYEGFGNVIIEALSCGLPVFVSNCVTDEANISKNFHKINSFDLNEWKNVILDVEINERANEYMNVIDAGYDIMYMANKLEQIYKDLIK